MHILIIVETFPPETRSVSTLYFELAESLVKLGHKVSVITRMPYTNIAEGTDISRVSIEENMAGINIFRCRTPRLARTIPFIRGLDHFLLGLIFFLGGLKIKDFDLVLIYSPPLPVGVAGICLGKIRGRPVIVNVQDLHPQQVIDLGLLKNPVLIKISKMMEFFIYRKADFITAHSEGNRNYIIRHGGHEVTTTTLYNWVDTELIKPGPQINDFSKKHQLSEKFVVNYTGTMGFFQGLDMVVEAARLLKDEQNILFVLVGDGVKKSELEMKSEKFGLTNILFIPTQPLKTYPLILDSSAVCLLTLHKNLTTPTVPGKLMGLMAAGKPILASVPQNSDARKIIAQSNCGLCVSPENPAELAKAVLKLYNNIALRKTMGEDARQAAEQFFSREAAVLKYELLFNKLARR